ASPGSSSTSTNWRSSPEIVNAISWARRPLKGGGTAALTGAVLPSTAATCGTSRAGVHALMPAPNTSVSPVTLPFLAYATRSSHDSGPTCWLPSATYHIPMRLLLAERVALDDRDVVLRQPQQSGELRQVHALPRRHLTIAVHHGV